MTAAYNSYDIFQIPLSEPHFSDMINTDENINTKGNENVTYKEARVYLDKVSKYGSVLGLGTIRKLLCELGNPQDDLKFIHIAGTNGKGSVLAYTSTILSKAGYRVGRYLSPTVVSYLERIQVDAQWIPEDAFARLTALVQKAIACMKAAGETGPTVFEIETAIAFLYFKEQGCDLVVLECGLGGAEDATNIIRNTLIAVFTSISRDHLGILGNSLAEIAAKKSGIIKPGCRVVSSVQLPEVTEVLTQQAEMHGCPYVTADESQVKLHSESYKGQLLSYKEITNACCPLAGRHQIGNAATALETVFTLRTMGYHISNAAICQGLKETAWPGRFTCLGADPLFFIDGAHNEDAAKRLRETLETYFPGKYFIYIMGVFKDKEYEEIAKIMAPLAKSIHTVALSDTGRTLLAAELADVMRRHCQENVPVHAEETIQTAVANALMDARPDDIVLAFGSLSYLGQVMADFKRTSACGSPANTKQASDIKKEIKL